MAKKTYGLADEAGSKKIAAPKLPYEPRDPKRYHPPIGLIGCGGITQSHLRAYRKAGYNVAAMCDIDPARAEARRAEFFPRARTYSDYREVLKRDDIEVLDIATHPDERYPIVEAALKAGKHVLSQKPFVLDLDKGHRLADLADKMDVKLAVNQNGRWAPYFSYIRQAIARGLIGDVLGAHLSVHWNHDWILNTPFNKVHHIVLYDFAIHWFDIVTCFLNPREPSRVFASLCAAAGQRSKPPLLGEAIVQYDGAQASLVFDAFAQYGAQNRAYVAGTKGTIQSIGPNLDEQTVTLYTRRGYGSPALKGAWFPDGFHGTMGELLCAIEEKRQPFNSARDNLRGLALCFAAVRSADTDQPQIPGKVRKIMS